MIKTITQSDFTAEFHRMGRGTQFSHVALLALYDYIEDTYGEDHELDVIGLCCEFCEYDSLEDALEENNLETREDLEDRATIIEVPGSESVIINQF